MSRSILIVEDEKEIRDLLALYLRKEGFTLSFAVNGEEGLSRARSEKPALILLDILLPAWHRVPGENHVWGGTV